MGEILGDWIIGSSVLGEKDREESPRLKSSYMITNTVIGNLKRRDKRTPRRQLKDKQEFG